MRRAETEVPARNSSVRVLIERNRNVTTVPNSGNHAQLFRPRDASRGLRFAATHQVGKFIVGQGTVPSERLTQRRKFSVLDRSSINQAEAPAPTPNGSFRVGNSSGNSRLGGNCGSEREPKQRPDSDQKPDRLESRPPVANGFFRHKVARHVRKAFRNWIGYGGRRVTPDFRYQHVNARLVASYCCLPLLTGGAATATATFTLHLGLGVGKPSLFFPEFRFQEAPSLGRPSGNCDFRIEWRRGAVENGLEHKRSQEQGGCENRRPDGKTSIGDYEW